MDETSNRRKSSSKLRLGGRKDLKGLTFGKLLVIDKHSGGRHTIEGVRIRSRLKWLCRCECGRERAVLHTNLTRGNSKTCGLPPCIKPKYNFTDLTGRSFGDLTVIERSEATSKSRGSLWICKCTCGNEVELPSNGLTSGNNITCGNRDNHYRSPRHEDLPINQINTIRQNAIKRNRTFSVTADYIWDIFVEQNRKCALSGVPIDFTTARDSNCRKESPTTASLDRIDNSKGYDPGNVRWVHKRINIMRGNMTDEEFVNWCRIVVKYCEQGKT